VLRIDAAMNRVVVAPRSERPVAGLPWFGRSKLGVVGPTQAPLERRWAGGVNRQAPGAALRTAA